MRTKKIYSLFLAKDLCRLGHKIVDLAYIKEEQKQIFTFEVDDTFFKDFKKLSLAHLENKKNKA